MPLRGCKEEVYLMCNPIRSNSHSFGCRPKTVPLINLNISLLLTVLSRYRPYPASVMTESFPCISYFIIWLLKDTVVGILSQYVCHLYHNILECTWFVYVFFYLCCCWRKWVMIFIFFLFIQFFREKLPSSTMGIVGHKYNTAALTGNGFRSTMIKQTQNCDTFFFLSAVMFILW